MADETADQNHNIFIPTGYGWQQVDESLIPKGLEPNIYPAENGLNLPSVYDPRHQHEDKQS